MKTKVCRVALAALMMSACAPDEAEFERIEQPINGLVVPGNPGGEACLPHMPRLRRIAQRAFAAINNPAIEDCLRQAIISYTETGWAEEIIARLRANQTLVAFCRDLEGERWAQANELNNAEIVTFDTPKLADSNITDDTWAGVILHEVAHNRHYSHPVEANTTSSLSYDDTAEYAHSVNRQIERCGVEVLQGKNPPEPNGWRLDTLVSETTMSPTGRAGGGQPYEITCRGGEVAFGVQLKTGSLVDSIGLSCTVPGTGGIFDTEMTPAPGGQHSFNDCPRDFLGNERLLVGIHGRAGAVHDSIGLLCATAGDIASNRPGLTLSARPGVQTGTPFVRRCPPGMIVRAIKGRAGNLVDRVEVECQDLARLEVIDQEILGRTGQPGPHTTIEKCAGRSALVGLTGHVDQFVDRLGGFCSEVLTTCAGNDCTDDVAHINSRHFLPAHGGSTGRVSETISNGTCGFGAVLVGLKMRAGDLIDQIAGVCAQADEWGRNGGTPRTMPALGGGNGGTDVPAVLCPRTKFLVGWRISHGGRVNSIEPICRNFN